jgi:hypothetical protein
MGLNVDGQLLAQSNRIANAPQNGHPDVGGIYKATVRISLEPDLPFRYFQS